MRAIQYLLSDNCVGPAHTLAAFFPNGQDELACCNPDRISFTGHQVLLGPRFATPQSIQQSAQIAASPTLSATFHSATAEPLERAVNRKEQRPQFWRDSLAIDNLGDRKCTFVRHDVERLRSVQADANMKHPTKDQEQQEFGRSE